MITDFFSHKIHSSNADWPDKLVELAFLFSEFDGRRFDRNALENRLQQISPRSAYTPRDPSKFRDEISAYPAYLGLYHLKPSPQGWVVSLSDTAKQFLCREEPDVAAFLRLQLTLFQYPNGMGAAYQTGTNRLRLQANARDRTLGFIGEGVHLSPLRLVCKALAADATLRNVDIVSASVSYEELYTLANHGTVNTYACPPHDAILACLTGVRDGTITPPPNFERRFHLLKHVDLFNIGQGQVRLRTPVDEEDRADLLEKVRGIMSVKTQFEGFDTATTERRLIGTIASGKWGEYFDGMKTFSGRMIRILAHDVIEESVTPTPARVTILAPPTAYALTARGDQTPAPSRTTRTAELADPEVTRIKRQRRNLKHKMLVDKIDSIVRRLGSAPLQSPHIDLYAAIPGDGALIFEIKSGGENLLEQIRKGLSQLYEYRFRYRDSIAPDSILCLVLGEEPQNIPWLPEYLCRDREVALCWFDNSDNLQYPDPCGNLLGVLDAQIPGNAT